jgi:hypothetical protein
MMGGKKYWYVMLRSCHFRAQKSLDFQGPPLPMPLVMMLHPLKTIMYRAIKTTGTLIVIIWQYKKHFKDGHVRNNLDLDWETAKLQ